MRTVLVKLLGLVLLSGGLYTGWLWMAIKHTLNYPLDLGGITIHYTVKPGMTIRGIAYDLAKADILFHPDYLVWAARWQGKATKIQAGAYEIRPGTTPQALLDMLVRGQVAQYALTLIEGWTFNQVMATVAAHPKLTHTLTSLGRHEIMQRINHTNIDPEGLFFPDTYYFTAGTTDLELLRRAYERMRERLDLAWAQRDPDLPYKTPYEALILASLVEKETSVPAERSQIAGVFTRRLKQNMPLQTDPTVIYALGSQFDGNLHRRDLEIDSPYNTYRYVGLTPTPIALPSEAAIRAALHPADSNALYFVAKGDGSHHFSVTLDEHNRAVARYRLQTPLETK